MSRQDKDMRTVGQELGVRAVLKGRLVQRGDSLSITAELVDTRDGMLLWRDQYDRKVADILEIEREISKEMSEQLRLKLTGEDRRRLARSSTRSPEAYRLYLQGRFWWNRVTREGLEKSTDYFRQAVAIDPRYALAWAGLADSLVLLGHNSLMPPGDAYPKARAAATRAIELDDTLTEAHNSLAMVKTTYEWDWPAAEREHRRAIELNPEYGHAHHFYAWHLLAVGRLREAITEMVRARDVEPLSPYINANLGQFYYYSRNYERAVQESRRAMELEPAFPRPHLVLGLTYALQGKPKEMTAELNEALNLSQRGFIEVAYAASCFARVGQRGKAQELLKEILDRPSTHDVAPHLLAIVSASLGEDDRSFAQFEEALEQRSLPPWMLRLPLLDRVRSDPRFEAVLKRMGLPPY